MDSPSPYQSPSAPPPMPAAIAFEPPAVKAFGVIHLVFAGFGFLMGLWSLVSPLFSHLMVPKDMPGRSAQLALQDKLTWVTVMTGAFTLTLAVLLTISGLKLVRSRPGGVLWSNRYAWTSIFTKLVSLVVTVLWVMPAMRQYLDSAMPAGAGRAAGGAEGIIKGVAAASSVASPVIGCIYPALALYFLSRPAVKAWCALPRSNAP